jgi:hypothetical protein
VCFANNKSSEGEFFVPAGMHLAVKLLTHTISPIDYFFQLNVYMLFFMLIVTYR